MKLPVSPKLSLGLVLSVLASSIMANIATVSPAMLHLGAWAPFVYGTAGALVAFIAGYYKQDPLMTAGAAATAPPAPAPDTAAPALEVPAPAAPTALLPGL